MEPMTPGSTERLRAIIRTQTEVVAGDLEAGAVMQLIAERAQELTRASAGLIELTESDEVVYAVATGEATPYLEMRLKKEATRVNACSMISVPLSHRDETVGVLEVYAPAANNFDDGDIETLELLSELTAAHLSRAHLNESETRHSRRDLLTGLPNRRAFEERLPIELARAARSGRPLALVLLDLDGFKGVNDRLGPPAGDEVLRAVACILDESRTADDCFRIGGDKFAILMPETEAIHARTAAERVANQIRSARLGDDKIGASYGLAASTNRDSEILFAAADRVLLAAKDRLYGRRDD